MQRNYIVKLDRNEVLNRAKKNIWSYVFFRPETGAIIAFSILMTGLCLLKIFWYPSTWWMWLLFGIVGVAIMFWVASHDGRYKQQVLTELFYEQFSTSKLRTPELQKLVYEALEYHKLVFREINQLNAPLGMVLVDMDEWVTSVYNVAFSLDTFLKDPKIVDYLRRLIELRTAKPASMDSFEEYTASLATLEDTELLTDDFHLEMFREVKKSVLGAKVQLKETLSTAKDIHTQIAGLRTSGLDLEFVQKLRRTLVEQLEELDRCYRSVDRLFHYVNVSETTIEVA